MSDDDVEYWKTKRHERRDKRVVHPDRGCQVLSTAASVYPASKTDVSLSSVCDHCAGETDRSPSNWDAYRAATEAGKND